MVGQKIYKNPFLLFAPLLVLFVLITLVVHDDAMESDEGRYYYFAENLYNGFRKKYDEEIENAQKIEK